MKKTGKLLILLAMMLTASVAFSANVKVNAVVDRDQMGIGDSFTLNISVQSDEDFELTEPELPKVPGLEVINAVPGGRQSSSSMTIINGKTQFIQRTSQDYNFVLSPQKEGVFVIPAIDIKIKGQSYRTNPVKIEVQEEYRNGRAKPKGGPRFPPGYGGRQNDDSAGNPLGNIQDTEDLFEQMLQQQQRLFGNGGNNLPGFGQGQPQQEIPSRKLNIDTNDAFFIYLDLDKSEVYEGEQITANWYIYTRSNVESLDRVKFPDLRGFWKEIIEEVPALHFTEEIVNGMRYRKALLASHGLFPIKAGVAVIDEFRIKAKVRMPTQFGWGQAREYTKTSRRAEVKVLPLPQDGRSKNFSGAVGNYQVSLKTEGSTFPVNQPFSVKVRYEGVGNAKLIDLPNIAWPDGVEVYDTKSESKFFREGYSFKEFEILVIARKEGELKIPPFELSYFDPRQKKYISDATPELVLQITPGDKIQPANGSTGADPKKTVVADFKPQVILELPRAGFSVADYRLPIFLMTLLLGISGMLAHFFLQFRNLKFKPEFLTEIKTKLALIEKYSSENEYRKIGSEATNVIYILVANLAGQKKADQEIHLLINEIPSKDQQLYLQRITQLFDYFQLLGFSPEEIMHSVLKKKPLQEQIEMLKILAKEIVAKLTKQDKYNE